MFNTATCCGDKGGDPAGGLNWAMAAATCGAAIEAGGGVDDHMAAGEWDAAAEAGEEEWNMEVDMDMAGDAGTAGTEGAVGAVAAAAAATAAVADGAGAAATGRGITLPGMRKPDEEERERCGCGVVAATGSDAARINDGAELGSVESAVAGGPDDSARVATVAGEGTEEPAGAARASGAENDKRAGATGVSGVGAETERVKEGATPATGARSERWMMMGLLSVPESGSTGSSVTKGAAPTSWRPRKMSRWSETVGRKGCCFVSASFNSCTVVVAGSTRWQSLDANACLTMRCNMC